MTAVDVLNGLQRWYLAQCNDEWEHSFGVVIETLDNPGWSVKVDLVDTGLADRPYQRVETHRSEDDWIVSWRDERQWQAACGPMNLEETLERFLVWAAADQRQ